MRATQARIVGCLVGLAILGSACAHSGGGPPVTVTWIHKSHIAVFTPEGLLVQSVSIPGVAELDNVAWSPDGSRFAAVSIQTLWIINKDGSGAAKLLTRADFLDAPSWYPDGVKLLVAWVEGGTATVLKMPATGGSTTQLMPGRDARVSPNGATIAFSDEQGGLSIQPTAGGQILSLVDGSSEPCWGPTWSPDGKWIAFQQSPPTGESRIMAVRPDGTGLHEIGSGQDPAWSPKGDLIAFTRARQTSFGTLYVMSSDGSGVREVTPSSVAINDSQPSWSPDGKLVAVIQVDG